MPNLLLTAANWKDAGNVSPPAIWNGTAYTFTAAGTLTFTGAVAAGDTLVATLAPGGSSNTGHQISVLVNGAEALVFAFSTDSYPTSNSVNITLPAGATVVIKGLVDGCGYPPAFTLTPTPPVVPTYNCDCNDTSGNKTLGTLRADLAVRLGFGAQTSNLPPGMATLLNSFLIEAQELLYRRYDVLRTERFYSWALQTGVRMYDFAANDETCTKRIDPRKVTWVGVVRGSIWTPLAMGIPPELYSMSSAGWPLRYEIRQCIEVWPPPAATEGNLVIKGHFGLEPFAADTDPTTIDDRLVFLLALSNAKAHYGRPDAGNYVQEMETMIQSLVAGTHMTKRYLPGRDNRSDYVYTQPKPSVPFA